jgi:hypothetical protein
MVCHFLTNPNKLGPVRNVENIQKKKHTRLRKLPLKPFSRNINTLKVFSLIQKLFRIKFCYFGAVVRTILVRKYCYEVDFVDQYGDSGDFLLWGIAHPDVIPLILATYVKISTETQEVAVCPYCEELCAEVSPMFVSRCFMCPNGHLIGVEYFGYGY